MRIQQKTFLRWKICITLIMLPFCLISCANPPPPRLTFHDIQEIDINVVAYSPDGKFVAIGCSNHSLYVFDSNTGNLQYQSVAHKSPVTALAFSSSGDNFATGSSIYEPIKVWDTKTGKLVSELKFQHFKLGRQILNFQEKEEEQKNQEDLLQLAPKQQINSLCFNSDSRLIAAGNQDGTITVWALKNDSIPITTIIPSTQDSGFLSINNIKFTPDGKYLAAVSESGATYFWDFEARKIRFSNTDNHSPAKTIDISPDGEFFCVGYENGYLEVWQIDKFKVSRTLLYGERLLDGNTMNSSLLRSLEDSILSVKFSPNGTYIAAGGAGGKIKIWSFEKGDEIENIKAHFSKVNSIGFSPDGKYLVSAGNDNTVKFWSYLDEIKPIAYNSTTVHNARDWLSFNSTTLLYYSSETGDNNAKLEFDNIFGSQLPLNIYRNKLRFIDWQKRSAFGYFISIDPNYLWIFSDAVTGSYRTVARNYKATIYLMIGCLIISFLFQMVKKTYSSLEIAKKFFSILGWEKIKISKGGILTLLPNGSLPAGIVAILGESIRSDIDKAIKRLTLYNKDETIVIYYLYTDTAIPVGKLLQARSLYKREVVPIYLPLLRLSLFNSNTDLNLLLSDLEMPFLVRTDPYAEYRPIVDPVWFFGRIADKIDIPSLLAQGQHVGLFGLRKIGKTSLINQIKYHLKSAPTILIDCQSFPPSSEILFAEIVKLIKFELNNHGILELRAYENKKNIQRLSVDEFRINILELFGKWKATGRHSPFVIILDEIDKFFPSFGVSQKNSVCFEYASFFRALRGLSQTNQCLVTLVTAYRPDVNRKNMLSEDVGDNPMYRSFEEKYLGGFSLHECKQMLKEIGMWKDIVWSEEASTKLYYYCGGHPLVCRLFASIATDSGKCKKIDIKKVDDTAKLVVDTFRKNDIGNFYQEGIWGLLENNERELMLIIASGWKGSIKEGQIPLRLKESLTNLENFGLVFCSQNNLSTTYLFYEWIVRNFLS